MLWRDSFLATRYHGDSIALCRELGEGIVLIDPHPSLIGLPALGYANSTFTFNLKARASRSRGFSLPARRANTE